MKQSYLYIILFSIFACIQLFIVGCSKDTVYVVIEDDIINDTLYYPDNETLTCFKSITCSIANPKIYSFQNQYVETSTTYLPLSKNIFVNLFIYSKDNTPENSKWNYFSVYFSLKKAVLYPIYNYIQLRDGDYTFYALSTDVMYNNTIPDIQPTSGLSTYLYNGETYYWWKSEMQTLSYQDTSNIEIKLKPLNSILYFKVDNKDEDTMIKSMVLTVPNPDESILSLSTGKISPVSAKDVSMDIALKNDEAKVSILPLITYEPLQMKLVIERDGKVYEYTKNVRQPKGNLFQGGYQYNYIIDLAADTIKAL